MPATRSGGVANGISVFGIAGGARLTGDRPIKEVGGPETGTSFFKDILHHVGQEVGDALIEHRLSFRCVLQNNPSFRIDHFF